MSLPAGLYWSEQGERACQDHTPYPGSDSWRSGRWAPVPAVAMPELARTHGADAVLCETCAAKARNESNASKGRVRPRKVTQ